MFQEWITHYHQTRKAVPNLTIEQYLHTFMKFDGDTFLNNRELEMRVVHAEMEWLDTGKPYYNIDSSMIEPTLRMKIDGIPVSMLDVPRDFKVVNIRFLPGFEIRSILLQRFGADQIEMFCVTSDSKFLHSSILQDDRTIEQWILEAGGQGEVQERVRKYVRFIALVKFLSDVPNEELISYDVLSHDKGAFQLAGPNEKEKMISRARKKGKIGWNIGVKEHNIWNAPRLSNQNHSNGERELSNSHIRTGHLHAVRFGEKKQHVKVMWFRPTVVRPDLGFK